MQSSSEGDEYKTLLVMWTDVAEVGETMRALTEAADSTPDRESRQRKAARRIRCTAIATSIAASSYTASAGARFYFMHSYEQLKVFLNCSALGVSPFCSILHGNRTRRSKGVRSLPARVPRLALPSRHSCHRKATACRNGVPPKRCAFCSSSPGRHNSSMF